MNTPHKPGQNFDHSSFAEFAYLCVLKHPFEKYTLQPVSCNHDKWKQSGFYWMEIHCQSNTCRSGPNRQKNRGCRRILSRSVGGGGYGFPLRGNQPWIGDQYQQPDVAGKTDP
jgi:hypothetical protein